MKLINKIKISVLFIVLQIPIQSMAEYGNIESIYINMPQEQNQLLSPKQRFEMIEYYKAGQADSTLNLFGGLARIYELNLEQQQIKLSHTPGSLFEMKLFISPKDSLLKIGVIETVCSSACSSVIKFYDEQWKVSATLSPKFKADDFFDSEKVKSDSLVSVDEIRKLLQPIFLKAEFHKHRNAIIVTNETIHTLSADDQEKYAKYVISKEISIDLK